jgi:hypothetical protein
MMGFLGRKRRFADHFQGENSKKRAKGAISGALLAISRVDEKAQQKF